MNTILFDLDGTLIPFWQKDFIDNYMRLLGSKCTALGLAMPQAIEAIWQGTAAMIKNDGSRLNHQRFWQTYSQILGEQVLAMEPYFDQFYAEEFDQIKQVLGNKVLDKAFIEALKAKGYTIILATNPLFPPQAIATRLAWLGLAMADFDHITHYSNSHFCKPNLGYYREILQIIGKEPADCLMVGNNVHEDMVAAELGLDVYLITDYLENEKDLPYQQFKHGDVTQFKQFALSLPNLE